MGVYNMPPFLGIVRNVDANPDENVEGDLLRWDSSERLWKRAQDSNIRRISTQATKTAAYSMVKDDEIIYADATDGAFTVTLPPVGPSIGLTYHIKRINTNGNAVTVEGST